MDLFDKGNSSSAKTASPLAERMRPGQLSEFTGQEHAVGDGALIRRAIETDKLFSMILWGPPGCGKTTLARIIANETRSRFIMFSAVLSGVKEIRSVVEEAGRFRERQGKKTVLFVDEIHRFNKAQQDAFLPHVESGLITLIGATTENPSFEVIPPLLSRCRVITLKSLSESEIGRIIDRAVSDSLNGLASLKIALEPKAREHLIRIADGDARTALNGLELATSLMLKEKEESPDTPTPIRNISLEAVEKALAQKALLYDFGGEEHYNLISALHKSMRGSDPDASLYWLARMLSSGEDPLYIARRMVRFATEDIGNADPQALSIAVNAMEAFKFIGLPEGELALAQAAVYLSTAPKSNRLYAAYGKIKESIRETGSLPVPLHIRNAPTRLMKELGYGKGYQYAHDFEDAYAPQEYLPEKLRGKRFYIPSDRGFEKEIKRRIDYWNQLMEKQENRVSS
jgi:putative ATPase